MIVAVDTGGTKTLITVFSRDGIAGKMIKFPTPQQESDYIETLREVLKKNYGGQRIEAIVFGVPSVVKDNVAVGANNLKWENFDIAKKLKGVLGSAPIFLENDANLGALAETRSRKPMPRTSLYIGIGTGIGTGIITNGKIDPHLSLSEGGQMMLEHEGSLQQWEDFASGRAIYKKYNQYARDITEDTVWKEIANSISRGLLVAIPLLQPEVVIIGGSIGTYFSRYSRYLKAAVKKDLRWDIPCPPILEANHPEEAVIYGCYYYAIDQLAA
jgi:predicted NBD/HSP70 family sugar kinase